VILLSLALALTAASQTPDSAGAFVLHKIGNPIGRESWQLRTGPAGARTLTSHFEFKDRGSPVPLDAELDYGADGRPSRFTLHGRTSRQWGIDLERMPEIVAIQDHQDRQARAFLRPTRLGRLAMPLLPFLVRSRLIRVMLGARLKAFQHGVVRVTLT
jgi:hypothetical protein